MSAVPARPPYALCPVCTQRVRTGVPKGGDGSVEVFYRHKRMTSSCGIDGEPEYRYCPESRQVVRPAATSAPSPTSTNAGE